MRFVCGDVRDHIVRTKLTTDLRIGATEHCNSGEVQKSAFARFSASFDFRLLQQYLPITEVALIRSSSPRASTGCDGHSGSPACRNPSSISREVFGTPIRAQHVFEIGNT